MLNIYCTYKPKIRYSQGRQAKSDKTEQTREFAKLGHNRTFSLTNLNMSNLINRNSS